MAKKKLRVGVLFGGRSGEHEVSLLSAASILKAIDRKKYDVVPIGISKQGKWLMDGEADRLLRGPQDKVQTPTEEEFALSAAVLRSGEAVRIPGNAPLVPEALAHELNASAELVHPGGSPGGALAQSLDVIFPVLHGTFGEDGTIQGMLELSDVAYVGSGVLGSAVGMDKDAMKKVFTAVGLPQTPYVALLRSEWRGDPKRCQKLIEKALRYPLFVKPANLGSSLGISKVHARNELGAAMDLAAGFDRKLVIEEGVGGPGAKPRELEVGVLGNDQPEASVVGEIIPAKEFYDYEAKYQMNGPDESLAVIPAKLSSLEMKQIRRMAIAAFRACDCAGLARVDFLMEPSAKGSKPKIFLNEINTMPGFTSISMYPKLWQASGVEYKQLIDRLIALAIERHNEKKATTYSKT